MEEFGITTSKLFNKSSKLEIFCKLFNPPDLFSFVILFNVSSSFFPLAFLYSSNFFFFCYNYFFIIILSFWDI
jgi:hypothetical protein